MRLPGEAWFALLLAVACGCSSSSDDSSQPGVDAAAGAAGKSPGKDAGASDAGGQGGNTQDAASDGAPKTGPLTSQHCPGTAVGPAPGTELFVAASGTDGRIASTLDGETWQDVTTASKGPIDPGHTRNLIRGVGYGGGVFVAVGGYDNAYISTTCDGVNFHHDLLGTNTDAPPPPPYDNFLEAVTFAGGAFVAVGGAGVRLRSSDYSLSWQSTGSWIEGHLRSVATGNGLVLAVGHDWGGGNGVWTVSADAGASWSAATITPGELWHVAFGNGVFVAVGPNRCTTTKDGNSWSPCTAGAGSNHGDVRFINGKFYLQNQDGSFVTSSDGSQWSAATPGWLPLATAQGASRFVMVNVNTRGYSTDFTSWKEFSYPGMGKLAVARSPTLRERRARRRRRTTSVRAPTSECQRTAPRRSCCVGASVGLRGRRETASLQLACPVLLHHAGRLWCWDSH
ncbi:MAG: hypothetical protein R3B13_16435 [Polyangiaceae bacterium]